MNKEKLKKIPHFISGVVILLHSLERFESNHKTYIVFLVAGIIFFSLAIFHKYFIRKFPLIDIIFYGIESLLSFLIAYEYLKADKKGLPIAYCIAGIIQLIAIYKFRATTKNKHSI